MSQKRVQSHCAFQPYGKFHFPQANAGSSTAMTFYVLRFPPVSFPIWRWLQLVIRWFIALMTGRTRSLLFLTQKSGAEPIYFLNPGTGGVVNSVSPETNFTIGSMAWDGESIRVANVTNNTGEINSINPSTGAETASLPVPDGRGEGMTYDGTSIYYSTQNRIREIDPQTGNVIRTFSPPGGGVCRALTNDGQGLIYSADPLQNQITVFDSSSLDVVCQFTAPEVEGSRVEALAYDPRKKTLYIAHQGEDEIYFGVLA